MTRIETQEEFDERFKRVFGSYIKALKEYEGKIEIRRMLFERVTGRKV